MTDLSNLNSDELNGYYKCDCEPNFQSAILTKVLSSHMALTGMSKYKAIYDLAMTVDE